MEQQEAEKLALNLMDEFGLLPEWRFEWDNAKRRFGRCSYGRGGKIISLSGPLTQLNPQSLVEDTIRHEIAHALDVEERGYSNHSRAWKRWAIKCGAKPVRCTTQGNLPDAPFYMFCSHCGLYLPRYRRVGSGRIYACGSCTSSYDPDYAVVPNVLLSQKKKLESGEMRWHELPQAQRLADLLEKQGHKTKFQERLTSRAHSGDK